MRIGIDNISLGEATGLKGPGGMRMYLQSLLAWFSKLAPQNEYLLFTPDWADPLLDEYPPNVQVVKLTGVPKNRTARILYQQTAMPLAIARHQLDVYFATATVAPLAVKVPVVLAVQFIQFYDLPQSYSKFRTAYLKMILPLSLHKARQVIIFSESSKRDLIRWTGIPATRVNVVPHGLAQDIGCLPNFPANKSASNNNLTLTNGRPYILYVSATYGYKNHTRLIQSFGQMKQRWNFPHVLLLVGSEVTVTYSELRQVAQSVGMADDVIFAGRLDPHEQVTETYLNADLAVIPTLYETFGFPALEAMACGCPVVTSNCGSMAELAGDAAILVDPYDIESISNGMAQVLHNSELRQSLIERGRKRAASYTWKQSAAQTLRILERGSQKQQCVS